MKMEIHIPSLIIVAGLGLATNGVFSLNSAEQLRHSHNPFAIQQSAYGKLFARLSETTVDRVWHLGVEEIVPHYMSGIEHEEEDEPAAIADGSAAAEEAREILPRTEEDNAALAATGPTGLEKGKRWIQNRVIAQHTRTNPNSLSQQHLNTVYKDIEKLLLRSFKMDPTHYGAYDSYHLFLTTYNLGGSPAHNEQAKRIAAVALSAARHEREDPEPWLTAASAGMNLYLMDAAPFMEAGKPIPLDILKRYEEQIGYCLAMFDEVQARSEKAGNWDRLSMERQMEIAERSRFVSRTFKQFEVMIARAESKTETSPPAGEVAETAGEKAE